MRPRRFIGAPCNDPAQNEPASISAADEAIGRALSDPRHIEELRSVARRWLLERCPSPVARRAQKTHS